MRLFESQRDQTSYGSFFHIASAQEVQVSKFVPQSCTFEAIADVINVPFQVMLMAMKFHIFSTTFASSIVIIDATESTQVSSAVFCWTASARLWQFSGLDTSQPQILRRSQLSHLTDLATAYGSVR
jgi:hypothetical protein